ncbi:oligopeptidase A [Candidatus Enterovibrio escicola]|uniref:oligopeptidase A n=1 Tax=Candidatus Enterovibrio escicola TaxID=1927127 RepID=UPI001237BC4B|nr:oligopeptidase A [Candidatus Enterovibrio escacola]
MYNPLLSWSDLPSFSKIKAEHVQPAVEKTILACRTAIKEVLENNIDPSWDSVCVPLAESDDILSRIWSPIEHMNAVVNSRVLRDAYEVCLSLLSDYTTWVGQYKPLYDAYKAIKVRDDFQSLSVAQQKSVIDALRNFELSGITLGLKEQHRFGEASKRLSELSSTFSNNVLDATMGWNKHITDKNMLVGIPESSLSALAAQAKTKKLDGWLLTLDFPSYLPVITYCDNRQLRKEMYKAYYTRASDRGPNAGKWDNTDLINEILQLSHEIAHLLGYASYSELSLSTKMASTTDQVMTFLNEMVEKVHPQGVQEFEELRQFANDNFGVNKFEMWDVTFYSDKLKQHQYTISDEEIRPYFPEKKVVAGLFEVVKRVFGVVVKRRYGVEVWNESVSFYDIFDDAGSLRGSFYLDLYAREHKRGGAWMNECRVRRVTASGDLQKPVAYLTCNFNIPIDGKPALFTHDEVVTLFHEFGHGLHHILTQVDVSSVSGINGVPWDAVEVPSQFLENWCWEKDALAFISGHYETGEPLPQDMLDNMLSAKNFQSAMGLLHQLELSLFDFSLFTQFDPVEGANVLETLANVRSRVAVMTSPEWNRFPHSFSHIFAGGYSAGYYSYLWAEVLSSDAFNRFEEEGIFNTETGLSFLENILERGASEEPMVLFQRFRGREPSPDTLLRHRGITEK